MGRARHWLLPAAWLAVMWMFSTHYFTATRTEQWIIPILHWLLPNASSSTLMHLHYGIRKMGHVFDFLVLSLLLVRAIRRGRPGWQFNWALGAWAIAACYSMLDELHQAFVPGRSPSLRDVLLDSAAAALGQVIFWLYRKRSARAAAAFEK
jgi:VanZ family protein